DGIDSAGNVVVADGAGIDGAVRAYLQAVQTSEGAEGADQALGASPRIHLDDAARELIRDASRIGDNQIAARVHGDVDGMVEEFALDIVVVADKRLRTRVEVNFPDPPRVGAAEVARFVSNVDVPAWTG